MLVEESLRPVLVAQWALTSPLKLTGPQSPSDGCHQDRSDVVPTQVQASLNKPPPGKTESSLRLG